jgi:hypothetical protein
MPIQFIASSFKEVALDRQADIYRMLHLAFDRGYLFEARELEKIWLAAHQFKWAPLPEKDFDIWFIIEKSIDPEISGYVNIG